MYLSRLIRLSLTFYRRQHLSVGLGVAIATAVITGALLIGDSVRQSLRAAALARLGHVHTAMPTADRFFNASLANELSDESAAAVMQLYGVAVKPDLSARANTVQVLGIDEKITSLLDNITEPESGEVVLNQALALQLNAEVGDPVILRFVAPSALSQDLPIGFEEGDNTISLRVSVTGIVDNQFSLRSDADALNAFVSRQWLCDRLEMTGRANLLLADKPVDDVDEAWRLNDAQLVWRTLDDGRGELRSERVFIDEPVVKALADLPGERILTYFVNTIAHGSQQTPYSMIASTDSDLGEDEIAINTWLADDLNAEVGDELVLTYFVADSGRDLQEAQVTLTVARIVPIEGPYADRTLVPDFPGLDDVDQISDWDGGPMIDRSRIRQKDEDYWDTYRATPKAFVSIKRGQALWANRFGTLTAIRLPPGITQQDIRDRLDPAMVGLTPRDVRGPALKASNATVDFGALFLSLSFFIIVSAVLLTGLLFVFGVEMRSRELGILSAVGWPGRRVRWLLLIEGGFVAVAGAAVGLLGGIGYTLCVLSVLSGAWRGAVGGAGITFHIDVSSLVIGFASGLAVAMIAMRLSMRSQLRRPVRAMLSGGAGVQSSQPHRARWAFLVAVLLFIGAAVLLTTTDFSDPKAAAGVFFGVGVLLLTGGLSIVFGALAALSQRVSKGLTLWKLAVLNTTRRRGRSLAVVALIASGVFLVIAVSGFYQSPPDDPTRPNSGTGGFTLIAESTLPIVYDINTSIGRDQYGIEPEELPPGSVVPVRVSGGDDASCLNLNQVPAPRLLGLDPAKLAERGSFEVSDPSGWALLNQPLPNGAIPAIADANTAQWALKLKIGDTITLTDDLGNSFDVQLVATLGNSILQGSLIVSESAFNRKYPGTAGYKMLLIDIPPDDRQHTSESLTQAMSDMGVSVTPTSQRLSTYNRVQNTYLSIFQALGGLGLLLGTVGIGVVVLRNILERRKELAMMRAVGITAARQRHLVMLEHAALLSVGLVIGSAAALISVAPTWRDTHTMLPLIVTLALMWSLGFVWVFLATRQALRGRLITALRDE